MNTKIVLYVILLLFTLCRGNASPTLLPADHATHVLKISNDTIFLINGTTYAYTVDTPKDKGVVSTGLLICDIQKQFSVPGQSSFTYNVFSMNQKKKEGEYLETGDILEVVSNGRKIHYKIALQPMAIPSKLTIRQNKITKSTSSDIVLDFIAGQRSPKATIHIYIPEGIHTTLENTTVDIIGRGEVLLRDLPCQSIGRTGTHYSYGKVGNVSIKQNNNGGQIITFSDIDLRPFNGIDLRLKIKDVTPPSIGKYVFMSDYITSEPQVYHSPITPLSSATIEVTNTITDLRKQTAGSFSYNMSDSIFLPAFHWTKPTDETDIALLQSDDNGKSWHKTYDIPTNVSTISLTEALTLNKLYLFKLAVKGGTNEGESNIIHHYSGAFNCKNFGVSGNGITDDTDSINCLIKHVHSLGGGLITFPKGNYNIRTIHLKSNVWLEVEKEATLQAIEGNDAPETTWFSDQDYRSGLSPTDSLPYIEPENYLTKQDVGHTFFRNSMFFAEREQNIKIMGNGRITGNGILVTTDKVMNNPVEKRADKMFTFKLCKNIEIGGYHTGKDLWYDPQVDEPYYIEKNGKKNFNIENMLHIDQGGHFVLLATGTDSIHVHDTYFGKAEVNNSRDIYDFMSCNDVIANNIYSKVSSDDIVKLGTDCSLGYTRPARNYKVRNIIGDTNCNLFQIGSETADDIQDVYVDNIYVLGSNKAGFSISTNDGGNVKNIFLNTGYTGPVHARSVMLRTRAPFFVSISNRGRVIGADVKMFSFRENDMIREELLCTNVNIGSVENIVIQGVDISEVYAGSSFRSERWTPYNGTQNKATPIIAGYKLPDPDLVEGGLNFKLPNGIHTGYIKEIQFNDINLLVKGGHPADDAEASPPEIGVGRYNVADMKIQPAYGYWFRHVKDIQLINCKIRYEQPDRRHAVVLDDVVGASIRNLDTPADQTTLPLIKTIHSENITIE